MKYRANAIGGSLTVDSKPNEGTTVTCHIPSAMKSFLLRAPKIRKSNRGRALDIRWPG